MFLPAHKKEGFVMLCVLAWLAGAIVTPAPKEEESGSTDTLILRPESERK